MYSFTSSKIKSRTDVKLVSNSKKQSFYYIRNQFEKVLYIDPKNIHKLQKLNFSSPTGWFRQPPFARTAF
jgi:hypothetical protein